MIPALHCGTCDKDQLLQEYRSVNLERSTSVFGDVEASRPILYIVEPSIVRANIIMRDINIYMIHDNCTLHN